MFSYSQPAVFLCDPPWRTKSLKTLLLLLLDLHHLMQLMGVLLHHLMQDPAISGGLESLNKHLRGLKDKQHLQTDPTSLLVAN